MSKKLYIFEPTVDVSTLIPDSILLASIDQPLGCGQYHTSLGDLSPSDIIAVAKKFDSVELLDHGFDKKSDLWAETKIVLNHIGHSVSVVNHDCGCPETFCAYPSVPTDVMGAKVWVFGCSHGHGVGLTNPEQRFGAIVAKHFDMPVNFVTLPGSSLQWSLRHLINADIGANDLVIWQLTIPGRLTLYNGTTNEVLLSRSKDRCMIEVFNDQQIFFHHCSLVNYGVKYLRAKHFKFVLTSHLDQNNLFYNYLEEYSKYPEYCYTPNCHLDRGTDLQHLGALSHNAIALRLIDHIQCLYD